MEDYLLTTTGVYLKNVTFGKQFLLYFVTRFPAGQYKP